MSISVPGHRAGFFIRSVVLCLLFLASQSANAGRDSIPSFPAGWAGKWKGNLEWHRGDSAFPRLIPMELHISVADSGRWNWHLTYGTPGADSRPYKLLAKNAAKGHWVIDENDGILLDQFLIDGKLSGMFSVQGTTIFNIYERVNDQLLVQMYVMPADTLRRSGAGTADVPFVDSYRIKSYQRAVLHRTE